MNFQAHVNTSRGVVAVTATEPVTRVFPAAPTVDLDGVTFRVIPHIPQNTLFLRSLGYEVPSPILTQYDWAGGTPFDVQKQTCAMLTMNQRAYVLNGMGTGKTKAALWAFDYLKKSGLANRMLVVAPLSTLRFTWAREIFNTTPHLTYAILHDASRAKRLRRLAEDVDIYIVNHDGVKLMREELAARGDINVVVLDELAVYRNGQSDRTKVTRALVRNHPWVWGMTGSPVPNSPTDVWAQATIITPSRVPKYYSRFRDDMMLRATQFKWIPKDDAVGRAFDVLQPSVRYTLDDVMELPECVQQTADVEMGAKQAKAYAAMANECHTAVHNKEITAANAGAAMMKLLQIATGWVYSADGSVVALDNEKRVEALLDAVESTDRKVLVFVPFKHALAGIAKAMDDAHISHAVVSGDTPASTRADIFSAFQNTAKYRVIVAHPQCLAHGITLTAADTIVWFAPVTSLEIYDQANHRIRRVGQKHKQLVLHLQSTAIEKRIYTLLRGKARVQDQLLELLEDATLTSPQY